MRMEEITGMAPDLRTYAPSEELVLPRGIIGIEIEAEKVSRKLRDSVTLWETTEDPSLRNEGLEFITPPIFGEDVIAALTEFETLCNKEGMMPEFTWRTANHVHLDVRDLDLLMLQGIQVLYIILEHHLFSYCDPIRWNSIYCLPVFTAPRVVSAWGQLSYQSKNSHRDNVRSAIYDTVKYQSLNFKPILSQGSIEFRHLQGTCSKDVMLPWINMILSIKKAAIEEPNADWISLVSTEGIDWLLNKVFGEDLASKFGRVPMQDVFASTRLAQDVYLYGDLIDLQTSLNSYAKDITAGKSISGYHKYRRKQKKAVKGAIKDSPEPNGEEGEESGGRITFADVQRVQEYVPTPPIQWRSREDEDE